MDHLPKHRVAARNRQHWDGRGIGFGLWLSVPLWFAIALIGFIAR